MRLRPSSQRTTHRLPLSRAPFGRLHGQHRRQSVSSNRYDFGRDDIEFVDATFGHNNPCEILIQEGRNRFPERRQMRILSIGTGHGNIITIENFPASIISALRNMAMSSRRVAHTLHDRFESDNQYFRFNVDQRLRDITLSDWEMASKISAHTRNYLAENEGTIRRFIDSLIGVFPTSGSERRPTTPSRCPHFTVPFGRNENFIGRELVVDRLLATIPPNVNADNCQRTAIVGLGGVGKTQIVLEVAFRVREEHPDCSVFWVPAIDAISFRNAYRNIGQFLGIDGINDKKANVEELVKQALNLESAGNWVLIVDNADSLDLFEGDTNLTHHLPFSRQGSLLFRSRNHEVMVQLDVPTPNVYTIEGMSENEGFRFLETHLAERQMSNRDDTAKLLDVLGYLPLALRQASTYIVKKQISTTKYLEYCRSSDKYMIELLSRNFEDRHRYREAQNPIATTWLILFRQVADHDPLAADFLKFMCFLSAKAIPRSLLPRDAWTLEAEDAIGTLKAYAFIIEREDLDVYDIHRLVQLAMLNWLEKQEELEVWAEDVIRRIEETFPFPEYDNRGERLSYLPHARHVLEHQTTVADVEVDLLCKVGWGFRILGQYRDAETAHRQELEKRESFMAAIIPKPSIVPTI